MDSFLEGQLAFLNNHFQIIAIAGEDQNLKNLREREKIATHAITMQRHISPVKDFVALIKLYFFFRKQKPDIVHSITPKAGLLSMSAAYFARVPVRMHTFTGLIFPSKKGAMRMLLSRMDKLLCRFATNVYPEGYGVKDELIRNKITQKPLKVLANGSIKGVNVEYFNPEIYDTTFKKNLKIELNIDEQDFVFIYVGRLVRDKGINELIDGFKALCIKHAHVKLIIAGTFENDLDPLKPETVETIKTHPDIIYLGYKNDVRPYYAIADVMVFLSYREGFPNVVLEAGAMSLPCIVTNISGSSEIIVPDENGVIIPSKNTKVLLEVMHKLITDAVYLKNLRLNARNKIINKFEQHLIWNALLKEYQLLSRNA